MTEPTDAEIIAVMRDGYNCRYNDEQDHIDFARAVLAKWGTPRPVAREPLTDEQTESLLWKYGYDPDDEHMAAMLKEAHGIKGGQHGTE